MRQFHIFSNQAKNWHWIVCWFLYFYLFLPVFAWCDHNIVLQIKTKQFYDNIMQKLVKTGKNTEINKQSNVKFWLNWIKFWSCLIFIKLYKLSESYGQALIWQYSLRQGFILPWFGVGTKIDSKVTLVVKWRVVFLAPFTRDRSYIGIAKALASIIAQCVFIIMFKEFLKLRRLRRLRRTYIQ
jgi:hypothetical protein